MARLSFFRESTQESKSEAFIAYPRNVESEPRHIFFYVPGDGGKSDELMSIWSELEISQMVPFGGVSFFEISLADRVIALSNILEQIAAKHAQAKLHFIATSTGSAVVTLLALNPQIQTKVASILHLDPANYPLTELRSSDPQFWDGNSEFRAEISETTAGAGANWPAGTFVMTVLFSLQNCLGGNYIDQEHEKRGEPSDIEGAHPRLNQEAAKAYHLAWIRAQGIATHTLLQKDSSLPHAFLRDGDLEVNKTRLRHYLAKYLKGAVGWRAEA